MSNVSQQPTTSRWGAPHPPNATDTWRDRPHPKPIGGIPSTPSLPPGDAPPCPPAADHDRRSRGYETFHEPSNNFVRDQQRDRGSDGRMVRGEDYRPRGGSLGGGGRDRFRDRDRGGGRWDRRDSFDERERRGHERDWDGRKDSRWGRDIDEDSNWRGKEREGRHDPRVDRPLRRDWRGPPSERRRGDDDRRGGDYYGPTSTTNEQGCPRDEFESGRPPFRKKPRKSGDDWNEDRKPIQREWPPVFESSGASFIFDARSGMFYEPASDFFYDPKTKLYYSNKKQNYFRFVADANPQFQPYGVQQNTVASDSTAVAQGVDPVSEATATAVVPPADASAPLMTEATASDTTKPLEKAEPKSKIAICLKTSTLPSKDSAKQSLSQVAAIEKSKLIEKTKISRKEVSQATPSTPAPSANHSHKEHAKDMDKWSERVKEMRDDATLKTPVTEKGKESEDVQANTPKIVKTPSGQPICVLCKRKFASVEKLQQHEKLSALHKENLAKKAAAEAKINSADKNDAPKEVYRDRSKERRLLYGDMQPHSTPSHTDVLLAQSLKQTVTEEVRPEETLGTSNVGNRLLQKLGWKSGESLGTNKGGGDGANNLKSDWEKIEALAQAGGRSR